MLTCYLICLCTTGVKIAVTEAEAENMHNDDESDNDKATVILEQLNAKMDQLKSLKIQVADFEKVCYRI